MKAQKRFKIAGIIVLILGIIHCIAIPFVLPMLRALPKMELFSCIYMFVCTGIAVFFVGWLQYYIARQAEINSKERHILKASVWFMLIVGFGAVVTMWNNPFAYIFLLVALYEHFSLKSLSESKL
jgi:hypothetical protein